MRAGSPRGDGALPFWATEGRGGEGGRVATGQLGSQPAGRPSEGRGQQQAAATPGDGAFPFGAPAAAPPAATPPDPGPQGEQTDGIFPFSAVEREGALGGSSEGAGARAAGQSVRTQEGGAGGDAFPFSEAKAADPSQPIGPLPESTEAMLRRIITGKTPGMARLSRAELQAMVDERSDRLSVQFFQFLR